MVCGRETGQGSGSALMNIEMSRSNRQNRRPMRNQHKSFRWCVFVDSVIHFQWRNSFLTLLIFVSCAKAPRLDTIFSLLAFGKKHPSKPVSCAPQARPKDAIKHLLVFRRSNNFIAFLTRQLISSQLCSISVDTLKKKTRYNVESSTWFVECSIDFSVAVGFFLLNQFFWQTIFMWVASSSSHETS